MSSGRGQVDTAAIAYIVFGIPGITGIIILIFALVHLFDIPA